MPSLFHGPFLYLQSIVFILILSLALALSLQVEGLGLGYLWGRGHYPTSPSLGGSFPEIQQHLNLPL